MIERGLLAVAIVLGGCSRAESPANRAEPAGRIATENTALPSPEATSREPIAYTSLKVPDCRLLEEDKDQAGYSRHACNGVAGYTLETIESDLRQDLIVIAPDEKRAELGLSGKVAKGAFNALGPAAEWRGTDPKAPTALIVRLGVADGVEPNRPDTSNLVVVRLKPSPCAIKIVPPGPGQNDRARGAADKPDGACL